MRHNSGQWDLQEAWRQLLGSLLPFLIKGGADPLGQPLPSSLECRCELQHSVYRKRPIKSQFIAHWFNFMLVTACLWIYYYMRKINSCLFQPLVAMHSVPCQWLLCWDAWTYANRKPAAKALHSQKGSSPQGPSLLCWWKGSRRTKPRAAGLASQGTHSTASAGSFPIPFQQDMV